MKIAVIGPPHGREALREKLLRYAESICADAALTAADTLCALPPAAWRLALIYAGGDNSPEEYAAYLDFLSANPDCEIVLWAEDDRMARIGLRSHARDFLLLPADDTQFLNVMKRCRSWADALRVISVSGAGGDRRLRCVEISYAESVGHSCVLHHRGEAISLSRGLSAVQEQLGCGFLRCHRGFVVNMRCVAELRERSLLLRDGAEIPLSPAQSAELAGEMRLFLDRVSAFTQGGDLP